MAEISDLTLCPYYLQPCAAVHDDSPEFRDVFFAYPSEPPSRAEALATAATALNEHESLLVTTRDWRDLDIGGRMIFCEICSAIHNSRLVIADVTDFNFNVMFEMGFAIGLGKPVWPLVEDVGESKRAYQRFQLLATLGYTSFNNSQNIIRKLERRKIKPWDRNQSFLIPAPLRGVPTAEASQLLYLAGAVDDEPNLRITELVKASRLDIITHNPLEVEFWPIAEYLKAISQSSAILLNLGQQRAESNQMHAANCSFVAGLALATGRRLLMLGEGFTTKPIDYHDMLKNYKNATEAEQLAATFVESILEATRRQLYGLLSGRHLRRKEVGDKSLPLDRIDLGDPVAQNEEHKLDEYFVETPQYHRAQSPGFKLIVGRKGTGKSAIAAMTAISLSDASDNIVVRMEPTYYELNELLSFLRKETLYREQGYFLESVWKFLIASEVIRRVSSDLDERSNYLELSDAEKAIKSLVADMPEIVEYSFAYRLVELLRKQPELDSDSEANVEFNLSEHLHRKTLRNISTALCEYLSAHGLSLTLLVDGLDGNWASAEDRRLMARLILALIYSANALQRSWSNEIRNLGSSVEINLSIFLRSDIFRSLLEHSPEPDKIGYEAVYWEDADALLLIVGKRVMNSLLNDDDQDFDWHSILEPGFEYENLRRYIDSRVIHRPRDAIVFFNAAINQARMFGRPKLSRKDFEVAEREYSDYVVSELATEWHPAVPDMMALLLSFVECSTVLTQQELEDILVAGGVGRADAPDVTVFLIETNFLGMAIDTNNFRYAKSPMQARVMEIQASRYRVKDNSARAYQIHRSFRENLGIRT